MKLDSLVKYVLKYFSLQRSCPKVWLKLVYPCRYCSNKYWFSKIMFNILHKTQFKVWLDTVLFDAKRFHIFTLCLSSSWINGLGNFIHFPECDRTSKKINEVQGFFLKMKEHGSYGNISSISKCCHMVLSHWAVANVS